MFCINPQTLREPCTSNPGKLRAAPGVNLISQEPSHPQENLDSAAIWAIIQPRLETSLAQFRDNVVSQLQQQQSVMTSRRTTIKVLHCELSN